MIDQRPNLMKSRSNSTKDRTPVKLSSKSKKFLRIENKFLLNELILRFLKEYFKKKSIQIILKLIKFISWLKNKII